MKLTLGQLQSVLAIPRETYRHWQKRIQPLSLRKGHRACFTHGELFAVSLIQVLTDQVGIPISKLDSVARTLFETCGQQPWTRFERQSLVVHPDDWSASFSGELLPTTKRLTIAIPCAPIIAKLRSALMIDQEDDGQASFRFPLASVVPSRGRQP